MKTIADYHIVIDKQTNGLISQVDAFIHEGWQPYKGLQIINDGREEFLGQIMVKYADEENYGKK